MRENGALNEAAFLITSLRGLPVEVPRDMDWHVLLELAAENGALPLLHHSLLEQGVVLSEFFTAAARKCISDSSLFVAALENLLLEFAKQHIAVIPLKGPVLAEKLYGNATMRSCNDLDLLVRWDDYSRAEMLLVSVGFAASSEEDDYHRRFVRDGVPVELHFGIASPRYFPFDLDGVWSRARQDNFHGKPMLAMSDDDLVLFLCLHGLKHGFSRLVWILDVAQGLGAIQHDGYQELAQSARRQGQEAWLLIGCEVVREMFPERLPQEMDAVIAESPGLAVRAQTVAARLFAEGLEVVNDHKIRGFYLQTERSMLRRWRCRLSYFAPTFEDYRWAERHRISRSLTPVLRPFRLLQKHGVSRVWRALFPPTA
jgi:hypothetical protein